MPECLAAAEMAETGQRCEERDQRGQRQESLHLHSRHLLLEVEVLERFRGTAIEARRLPVVALPSRKVALTHPGAGALADGGLLVEARLGGREVLRGLVVAF